MSTDLLRPSAMSGLPDAAVDGPSGATSLPADSVAVPADLLDGGELVILAVKPSMWSILFSSLQWLLAGAVIIACGRWIAAGWATETVLVQVVLTIVALRLGFAVMQWASRVYVLTNRRIMRIRGTFRADVFACPLVKIINTGVAVGPHEAITRLGTIWFNTGQPETNISWSHLARPHEVHAQIRRAIERALDHQQ
ncbi:MAG: PH domain-containing protein [Planctomycetota bacterium]|jgi:membrane protein YdbS with pleckstrin-like domain